jgi:hypothetical protein
MGREYLGVGGVWGDDGGDVEELWGVGLREVEGKV